MIWLTVQKSDNTYQELDKTYRELDKTYRELDKTYRELDNTHRELDNTHRELDNTHRELLKQMFFHMEENDFTNIKFLYDYVLLFFNLHLVLKKIVFLLFIKLYPKNEHIHSLSIRHFSFVSHWFLHWQTAYQNPI